VNITFIFVIFLWTESTKVYLTHLILGKSCFFSFDHQAFEEVICSSLNHHCVLHYMLKLQSLIIKLII